MMRMGSTHRLKNRATKLPERTTVNLGEASVSGWPIFIYPRANH